MRLWQIKGCVRVLRKDPRTELAQYINGHGLNEGQLLYLLIDMLAVANWQRTGKKSGQPKRLDQQLDTAAKAEESERRRAKEQTNFAQIREYLDQFDPTVEQSETSELIIVGDLNK